MFFQESEGVGTCGCMFPASCDVKRIFVLVVGFWDRGIVRVDFGIVAAVWKRVMFTESGEIVARRCVLCAVCGGGSVDFVGGV